MKVSEIFEGPNSSLKKAFDLAVNTPESGKDINAPTNTPETPETWKERLKRKRIKSIADPNWIDDVFRYKSHPNPVFNDGFATGYNTAISELENFITTERERAVWEAQSKEAYLWFNTWYAMRINPSTRGKEDFGKWATERLQEIGASEISPTPNH